MLREIESFLAEHLGASPPAWQTGRTCRYVLFLVRPAVVCGPGPPGRGGKKTPQPAPLLFSPGQWAVDFLIEQYNSPFEEVLHPLPEGTVTLKDSAHFVAQRQKPADIDDFAACGIDRKEDIRDLFVPSFYFGCEADDPVTSSAFDAKRNPFGVRLNVVFGSDIGHWDVPDMTEVTEEAYEAVEQGLITGEDFRDFVFTSPAELWTAVNPDFFKGTSVEGAVTKLLSAG
jgi:hypothetical protein